MTSNQSHQALVFGSISIDKIVNKYGTYNDVLGGSASYALLATKSKECQLVGMVGSDFPKNHFNLLGNHSINLDDLKIQEGKTFAWGGEYAHDFSSRETLYVDPGVSEEFEPILSKHSRHCDYLLLGNTHPELQLEVLNQIESKPFVILDTFLEAFCFFITPVLATLINSELSLGRNFRASSFFFSSIKRFIFFRAFRNLLFLALLTAVCLEILLIFLIADFVFAISAGV